MKFSLAAVTLLGAAVSALPASEKRQAAYVPCTGLYGSAQCCATDVLGLANLDCGGRK
jgi:alkylhydroperoxidase family enzyme